MLFLHVFLLSNYSFLSVSSIITSALDLMHMLHWSSMNLEVIGTLYLLSLGNGQLFYELQMGLNLTSCSYNSERKLEHKIPRYIQVGSDGIMSS